MPSPTPTPPKNPVPSEPGYYWAKHRVFGNRVIVQFDGGTVYLSGMSTTFPAVDFADWSGPITDPQPPAAPVAKEGEALDGIARIREAIDKVNVTASAVVSLQDYRSAKLHVESIEHLRAVVINEVPALLDELERLRAAAKEGR